MCQIFLSIVHKNKRKKPRRPRNIRTQDRDKGKTIPQVAQSSTNINSKHFIKSHVYGWYFTIFPKSPSCLLKSLSKYLIPRNLIATELAFYQTKWLNLLYLNQAQNWKILYWFKQNPAIYQKRGGAANNTWKMLNFIIYQFHHYSSCT